jgi:uncharacterized damage-inducible protein DinB
MADAIADLFKHNLWANLRLLDACASLSADDLASTCEGTYGPLGDTLTHMLASEERYVMQWTPAEATIGEDMPFPGFETLRASAQASGQALIDIASKTTADDILRGTYRDTPYEMQAALLLGQAINHATEHRAHVATIMSQRGITPPRMDVLGLWMGGPGG